MFSQRMSVIVSTVEEGSLYDVTSCLAAWSNVPYRVSLCLVPWSFYGGLCLGLGCCPRRSLSGVSGLYLGVSGLIQSRGYPSGRSLGDLCLLVFVLGSLGVLCLAGGWGSLFDRDPPVHIMVATAVGGMHLQECMVFLIIISSDI